MKGIRSIILLFAVVLFIPHTASAQIRLAHKGKATSRIVCMSRDTMTCHAATLFQQFIYKISGAELPVVSNVSPRKNDVVIGGMTQKAGVDGFLADCAHGQLTIESGGGSGAVNGVVHVLEKYLGVDYLAYKVCDYSRSKNISLPVFDDVETPAFRYRQTFSYGNADPDYYQWMALEDPDQVFVSDLWVHTFNRIMPASRYGKAHPEYYSMINGRRQPGDHSQLCLTNPEVFKIVCHNVDSIFRANPGLNMISISQNDGNGTYCQCPQCRAVDEYEGSPSGNIIRFLNKLAARFPDKQFSTLAYLYSMRPPEHVKPLPNVNIMLCDIDCKREVPLTDNESGRNFVQALEGWSKISNNIFVWDYGINFDNMVSPFPNFHILQKNIQLFKKNHATMLFEQVNGSKGTDFSEMRAYMLAKLMWNPYLDADSLMRSFMHKYYGKAAPYLYQYQKIMQGALLASGIPLWIYDSPISHKNGMLNRNLLKTYNELFDEAEVSVKDDSAKLCRVRMARLPLQYSELEIARTMTGNNKDDIIRKVNLFRKRTSELDVKYLNERNNKCSDYCDLYMKRYLPHDNQSLAKGAKITWISAPSPSYQKIADTALTDGLFGGTTYVEGWVGWNGSDAEFIMDLGDEKEIHSIDTDFLHQLGAWVLLPAGGTYSVSTDNKHYTKFGSFQFPEDRDEAVKFVSGKVSVDHPVKARYIKVKVNTIGMCPSWHYGVGYPAWFFMDEVTVL
jgi:hypothetical protein